MQSTNKIAFLHFVLAGLVIPILLIQVWNTLPVVTYYEALLAWVFFIILGALLSVTLLRQMYQITDPGVITTRSSVIYTVLLIISTFGYPFFLTLGYGGSLSDMGEVYGAFFSDKGFLVGSLSSVIASSAAFYLSTRIFLARAVKHA